MAVNVAGLIAVLLFYIVIFIAGIVAAKIKSKKNENNGREDEEVMLAGRNLGWFVGCFTMTGISVPGSDPDLIAILSFFTLFATPYRSL